MKILAYIPLAPSTPRIYARCLTSVLFMQWEAPCEIVMGREDGIAGLLGHYPGDRQAVVYQNITDKYNRARQMALDGGYDALLTVESDMVVPPLALERLTRVDADVVYGLYVSRHRNHKWLAFEHITESGTGVSLSDDALNAQAAWGLVVETRGVGFGCTLIRRPVLERVAFRCPEYKYANDWYFALDVTAAGFTQKHDCGVVCGHIQGPPDAKIYWPEPDGKYSVQFFEGGLPEAVNLSAGYTLVIDHFGTKELFPPPEKEMA